MPGNLTGWGWSLGWDCKSKPHRYGPDQERTLTQSTGRNILQPFTNNGDIFVWLKFSKEMKNISLSPSNFLSLSLHLNSLFLSSFSLSISFCSSLHYYSFSSLLSSYFFLSLSLLKTTDWNVSIKFFPVAVQCANTTLLTPSKTILKILFNLDFQSNEHTIFLQDKLSKYDANWCKTSDSQWYIELKLQLN